MTDTQQLNKNGFTARAEAHLGQRFFVESLTDVGADGLVFLGRLIRIERTRNYAAGDVQQDPISINYVIEAKAGAWDKSQVASALQDPKARLQLLADWREADEITRFELTELTHSATVAVQVRRDGKLGPPIFGNVYKLSGSYHEYRWQFLDG